MLTEAVRRAWDTVAADGIPTRRVWLHTSSLDHPHAMRNYTRRGFRPFNVLRRQRELPE